jgi:hypothetical protein
MKRALLVLVVGLMASVIQAGDAIAIGFNYAGIWTAVTYNRSSTPRGGLHYHDSAQARLFAVRDLYVRAPEDLIRTKIIGQSDLTGYVAIARGHASKRDTDVTAIGRGKSQGEADSKALQKLNLADATTNEEVVFRYFSYGADSGKHAGADQKAARITKPGKRPS